MENKFNQVNILTIHGSSSSIKFALLEVCDSLQRILKSAIERIGLPQANLQAKGAKQADDYLPLTIEGGTT